MKPDELTIGESYVCTVTDGKVEQSVFFTELENYMGTSCLTDYSENTVYKYDSDRGFIDDSLSGNYISKIAKVGDIVWEDED